MKRAFLFPGQGAQTIGMGKDIYEKYEEAKEVYEKASQITGIDIKKLCFEGPEEELNKTQNTQIAILVTSLAIQKVLEKNNIEAQYAAGLSLGEYSALIYAKMLSFEEGIKLIQKRGYYMGNLLPKEQYEMAAVIGLNPEKIEKICEEISKNRKIYSTCKLQLHYTNSNIWRSFSDRRSNHKIKRSRCKKSNKIKNKWTFPHNKTNRCKKRI